LRVGGELFDKLEVGFLREADDEAGSFAATGFFENGDFSGDDDLFANEGAEVVFVESFFSLFGADAGAEAGAFFVEDEVEGAAGFGFGEVGDGGLDGDDGAAHVAKLFFVLKGVEVLDGLVGDDVIGAFDVVDFAFEFGAGSGGDGGLRFGLRGCVWLFDFGRNRGEMGR